jgi:hypothetical protein
MGLLLGLAVYSATAGFERCGSNFAFLVKQKRRHRLATPSKKFVAASETYLTIAAN